MKIGDLITVMDKWGVEFHGSVCGFDTFVIKLEDVNCDTFLVEWDKIQMIEVVDDV